MEPAAAAAQPPAPAAAWVSLAATLLCVLVGAALLLRCRPLGGAPRPPPAHPDAPDEGVVSNHDNRRYEGRRGTASRLSRWFCRSRGISAAVIGSAKPFSWAVLLNSIGSAILRALCCSRYRGPSAHAAARGVHYAYGVADACGRRDYMEDRHLGAKMPGGGEGEPSVSKSVAALVPRGVAPGAPAAGLRAGRCSVYGVYDGHAGHAAADYCTRRMVQVLSDSMLLASQQLQPPLPPPGADGAAAAAAAARADPAVAALVRAYCTVDGEFLAIARSKRPPMNDGTTALTALICDDTIHVANVGDSRAVLVRVDGGVQPLSSDHKPNRRDEVARIVAAGGRVLFNGIWRVCGVLAVSRAIGDRVFKPAIVTCQPEVATYGPIRRGGADAGAAAEAAAAGARSAAGSAPPPPAAAGATTRQRDLALVLASDGLFDTLSNEDVGAIVTAALSDEVGGGFLQPPPPVVAVQPSAGTLPSDQQQPQPQQPHDSDGSCAAAQPDPLDACTCDGRSPQAEAAALRLVSAALDRGTFDNVTALVIDLRALVHQCPVCVAASESSASAGGAGVRS